VVSNWKARGTVIEPVHCSEIERLTGGAVTRQELHPDDWQVIWPELAAQAA
jgi:DNA-binding transcriptional regulator YdaS (Cro superfamily)